MTPTVARRAVKDAFTALDAMMDAFAALDAVKDPFTARPHGPAGEVG